MPKTTPFYESLSPLNQTGLWKNWSGYLVAPNYQYSLATEYYAIRNSVAAFDTSPLFKYLIRGSDAEKLLASVFVRDIRKCGVGRAQYTCWCNEAGFVLQDGVVLRTGVSEFLLTSAEPSLRHFRKQARSLSLTEVNVDDISSDYGILALQGPHAFHVANELCQDICKLQYFGVTTSEIDSVPVIVSRTGFTGDLGYEFWIPAGQANDLWTRMAESGAGYNLTPIGSTALKMARVEAGLLLLDVDFHNAKHAWVDAQRESPSELGWDWMLKGWRQDDRQFVGRSAIELEIKNQSSRWRTVGLEIDWHDFERVHLAAGIPAPKHELYSEGTMSVYRRSDKLWDYAGYATSFMFSSLLKKPIAIAKLPLELAKVGTEVDLEVTVIKQPVNVLARVVNPPFYNPTRKTASMEAK